MGKFSGILLASDFDGTLASSAGVVSAKNREAIRYFIENGGYFTVCTGRSVQGFHAYDAAIINAPVINANGAVIYDYAENAAVFTAGVSNLRLLDGLIGIYPDLCIEMYNDKLETFVINPDERSRRHLERQLIKYTAVASLEEVRTPLVKIMISAGRERCLELQSLMDGLDMGELRYIPTDGDFLELHRADAGKGNGLLRLAASLHIDRSRVYCMGDGSNDVDMLRAAVGLVPANGDRFAKSAASYVIASNDEDAAADAVALIERLVCQNGK